MSAPQNHSHDDTLSPIHLAAVDVLDDNPDPHFLWRVTIQVEEEVTLYFLVAGHTKNRCDGAFGFFKRQLKHTNVHDPAGMMIVVDVSFSTNRVVCSTNVRWANCKLLLERFHTIPPALKITKYHCFWFRKPDPSSVKFKRFSTDSAWTKFRLMKLDVTTGSVRRFTVAQLASPDFEFPIEPLVNVPSAYEGNREAYLVKNILERYYSNEFAVRASYFEYGKAWQGAR